MDAMSLFTLGMLAGIAVIYAIILYVKVATNYPEREMKLPERETCPVERETCPVVSFDDVLARYDTMIEIFAVREMDA